MLRQIFLTNKYNKKGLEEIEREKDDTARMMMHSRRTQLADYVKKT